MAMDVQISSNYKVSDLVKTYNRLVLMLQKMK